MEPINNSSKLLIKGLKFLYTSFLIGSIVFTAIIFYLNKQNNGLLIDDKNLCLIFWYISIALLGLIPLSYYIYKRKVSSIDTGLGFEEKISLFKSAYMVKVIMLDASIYLTLVIFLFTNNQYVLYQAIISIIFLALNYPYRTTIADDLNLSQEDTDKL